MSKLTKKDIIYAMKRLESHVDTMSDEEIDIFVERGAIFCAIIPPKFIMRGYETEHDLAGSLTRLEFRIS